MTITSIHDFESFYYENFIARKEGELSNELNENYDKKEREVKSALNEYMKNNDVVASISISKEGKEKLFGSYAEEMMKQGINLLYKEVDKSDVFSIREGNKWAVFNDYLKYTNAYDNISIDQNAIQGIMSDVIINDGAEVGECVYTDKNGRQLDSGELSLLLESSTEALHRFSNSFLEGNVKDGFDELIDKYYNHITLQLNGYQSVDEEFNHALASLNLGAKQNLEKFRDSEGILSDNRMIIAMKEKLGSVYNSDSMKKQYVSSVRKLFTEINNQNYKETLDKIQEQYIKYTSGYSNDDNLKNYIQNRSGRVFEQVYKSWSAIIKFM